MKKHIMNKPVMKTPVIKTIVQSLGISTLLIATVSCGSSSSTSSAIDSKDDNVTAATEILRWSDWTEGESEFSATTTYGTATGLATFDGGDFTPTQSDYLRSINSSDGDSYIGQSYNESYYIDFEITVDETYTALDTFSFDAYVNNSDDAQTSWTLSVEATNNNSTDAATEGVFPEHEITLGTVDRLTMDADDDGWQTLSFDLSNLADNDAGANDNVIFRLYAWGGTADSTETNMTAIDNVVISATEPDETEAERPGLGERADWMRGTYGINWKPADFYNGYIEDVSIDDFIEQIADLKTVGYIQTHLNGSNVDSPVHSAPNDILESLWGEDAVDPDEFVAGDTINLVVPRAASGVDPFKNWLEAVKAAGMKNQVYVNSSNMMYRYDTDNPDEFPDITERWKTFCDESEAVQAFLDSKPYYRDSDSDTYGYREYMFCYAEFILRDYAKTYGELIDGWLFDSGSYITGAGDANKTGTLEDQRLFQAFAEAIRAGNPDVAASFNNSVGSVKESWSPLMRPTLFDDYSFGHPFGGGNYIGGVPDTDAYGPGDDDYDSSRMYDKNYRIIEFMIATDGNVFDLDETLDYFDIKFYDHFSWDDQVVGHFDPPMATLSWNSGSTAALTDDHFTLWNTTAVTGGGAISWGGPLSGRNASNSNFTPTLKEWALEQLTTMDESLRANGHPDEPNWYRAETVLTTATVGESYSHTLTENTDFWYPGGNEGDITNMTIVDEDKAPAWLSIEQLETSPATFALSGMPTSEDEFEFELEITAYDGSSSTRAVTLSVEQ